MQTKLLGPLSIGLLFIMFVTAVFWHNAVSAVEMGTIVVIKDAVPNDSQDFILSNLQTFQNGNPSEFVLDDDGVEIWNPPLEWTRERSFEVFPGSGYKINEINQDVLARAGWRLVSIDCGGQDHNNITVGPGETVTCTFTNVKNHERIEIEKQTVPVGHPQEFEFTGAINASLSDNEAIGKDVAPGQYTISETALPGWTLNSIVCSDGQSFTPSSGNRNTATFNVENGETVRCVFNNSENATQVGQIVIKKETNPDGDTTSFEFDPSWSETNFFLEDNSASYNSGDLASGIYSLSEVNLPANWELTSVTCDDGSPINAIDLSVDEIVTCTFLNSFAPSIVQGCSPGYWKQEQHFDSYALYTPDTLFADVGFEDAFPGQTLLDVLSANGGGLTALGRTIVSAILNSAVIPGYPGVPQDVINAFNAVFEGTNASYNALKNQYEAFEGHCSLN